MCLILNSWVPVHGSKLCWAFHNFSSRRDRQARLEGRQSGRQYMYICATFTLSQSMFYYQHICPTITGVLTWSMLVCLYIASTKEWVHLWDRKTFFAIFFAKILGFQHTHYWYKFKQFEWFLYPYLDTLTVKFDFYVYLYRENWYFLPKF